jgi:hypothetical protein
MVIHRDKVIVYLARSTFFFRKSAKACRNEFHNRIYNAATSRITGSNKAMANCTKAYRWQSKKRPI